MRALVGRSLSATAFGLAVLVASVWWGAYTTMVMLHSDTTFEQALSATLDKPAVRSALSHWLSQAIKSASSVSGSELDASPVLGALTRAITSKTDIAPMADALTGVVVQARNEAVDQLDREVEPKHAVRLQLAPLLRAAGIKVDKAAAKGLGLDLKAGALSTSLLSGEQLDALQKRYTLTKRLSTWAGWVALALIALSVLTSRHPLRTLALAGAAVAGVALVAPWALARLAGWLGGTTFGGLLVPLLAVIEHGVRAYALPAAVGGGVLALVCAALHLVRRRSRAR